MEKLLSYFQSEMKLKKLFVLLLVLLFILIIYTSTQWQWFSLKTAKLLEKDQNRLFSQWPKFSSQVLRNPDWFSYTCWGKREMTIGNLYLLISDLSISKNSICRKFHDELTAIFTVSLRFGKVVIPRSFEAKVKKWLGNSEKLFEEVHNQPITFVFNEYTRENTIFNPLRAKRPISKPVISERLYVEELSKKTAKDCDFCNYKNFTAEDTFGRIESTLAYTAANTFKYDAWHSLILTRKHHPLNWDREDVLDVMHVAVRWFIKVHTLDSKYKYPTLIWDLLPHAGASQVHPHLHASILPDRYYGIMENWRLAADNFHRDFPEKNYFSALVSVHSALNLATRYKTAVAFANLVPKKDNGIVIIGEMPNDDFFLLLYYVLRALIDDMGKYCFSLGIAFPSLIEEEATGRLPVYARIITRGSVGEVRSEISSLELFTAANVNADPFKVAHYIKESVLMRSRVKS